MQDPNDNNVPQFLPKINIDPFVSGVVMSEAYANDTVVVPIAIAPTALASAVGGAASSEAAPISTNASAADPVASVIPIAGAPAAEPETTTAPSSSVTIMVSPAQTSGVADIIPAIFETTETTTYTVVAASTSTSIVAGSTSTVAGSTSTVADSTSTVADSTSTIAVSTSTQTVALATSTITVVDVAPLATTTSGSSPTTAIDPSSAFVNSAGFHALIAVIGFVVVALIVGLCRVCIIRKRKQRAQLSDLEAQADGGRVFEPYASRRKSILAAERQTWRDPAELPSGPPTLPSISIDSVDSLGALGAYLEDTPSRGELVVANLAPGDISSSDEGSESGEYVSCASQPISTTSSSASGSAASYPALRPLHLPAKMGLLPTQAPAPESEMSQSQPHSSNANAQPQPQGWDTWASNIKNNIYNALPHVPLLAPKDPASWRPLNFGAKANAATGTTKPVDHSSSSSEVSSTEDDDINSELSRETPVSSVSEDHNNSVPSPSGIATGTPLSLLYKSLAAPRHSLSTPKSKPSALNPIAADPFSDEEPQSSASSIYSMDSWFTTSGPPVRHLTRNYNHNHNLNPSRTSSSSSRIPHRGMGLNRNVTKAGTMPKMGFAKDAEGLSSAAMGLFSESSASYVDTPTASAERRVYSGF